MRMQQTLMGVGGLALSLMASSVMAQTLTQAEIDQLGTSLTPIGAEKAGNASGTIPAWTGGLPTDAGQSLANNFLEDPFKGEQPEFVITAQNLEQYKANLTPGQIALFERYPETFRMPVYKSQRTVAFRKLSTTRSRQLPVRPNWSMAVMVSPTSLTVPSRSRFRSPVLKWFGTTTPATV